MKKRTGALLPTAFTPYALNATSSCAIRLGARSRRRSTRLAPRRRTTAAVATRPSCTRAATSNAASRACLRAQWAAVAQAAGAAEQQHQAQRRRRQSCHGRRQCLLPPGRRRRRWRQAQWRTTSAGKCGWVPCGAGSVRAKWPELSIDMGT